MFDVKVESAMSMRALQPQVKAIQERYAGNQVNFFNLNKHQKLYGLVFYK